MPRDHEAALVHVQCLTLPSEQQINVKFYNNQLLESFYSMICTIQCICSRGSKPVWIFTKANVTLRRKAQSQIDIAIQRVAHYYDRTTRILSIITMQDLIIS
jgi:hypothetical protein